MNIKIAVYVSWFIFAIWSYIVLIYSISTLWFAKIKARKTFWDKKAILLETVLFTITLIGQVFTVYLYVDSGQDLIHSNKSTTWKYWTLISLNFFFVLCYLLFYLFFSNNLAIKFTDEKTYLIGMSIINRAFILVRKTKKNDLIAEYLYNQNKDKKWTEKLKFFHCFPSTKFFWENHKEFIDSEGNLALFDIYKVDKTEKNNVNGLKNDPIIKNTKNKPEEAKTEINIKNVEVKITNNKTDNDSNSKN